MRSVDLLQIIQELKKRFSDYVIEYINDEKRISVFLKVLEKQSSDDFKDYTETPFEQIYIKESLNLLKLYKKYFIENKQ